VGPRSIGPALRAGSSSTTTGRQAPLLSTHPSPRCGRRGFPPCRTGRRGIASQSFCVPPRGSRTCQQGQQMETWMGSSGISFRRTNTRAPTSSRRGRRKPLSRASWLSAGHGCPCGRPWADTGRGACRRFRTRKAEWAQALQLARPPPSPGVSSRPPSLSAVLRLNDVGHGANAPKPLDSCGPACSDAQPARHPFSSGRKCLAGLLTSGSPSISTVGVGGSSRWFVHL
jgi:hypothetical protein